MPVVEFQPLGRRVQVAGGATVLEAVQLLGRELGDWGVVATCGGQGRCGRCLVRVVSGAVSGADEQELELLARQGAVGYRLACRARVLGDVRMELDRVRGGDRLQVGGVVGPGGLRPEPAVRQVEFRVEPPAVGERAGDADRVAAAVGAGLRYDLEVLRSLSDDLGRWGFGGWAVVRGDEVIAVQPRRAPLWGLAVDLGTTKVAAYLVDLDSGEIMESGAVLNPQIAYGEDVVSRLGYASVSADNYRRIRGAVGEGLNGLAGELCRRAGCETADIYEAVVCGNTAMHHLLLGLPVGQLVRAPYVPALTGPVDVKARELGFGFAAGAYVHLMPCVAGYVGGDHVGVILATRLLEHRGVALAIDVGTNTEIALVREGGVTCCSCASGPAFEGGHVSRGMRALAGAIDRVWLEGEEIRYTVVGGGDAAGFCGAGLIDLLAVLLRAEVMDAGGRLRAGAPGVEEGPDGLQFRLGGAPLTQRDIRELQLAKAAVRSGIEGLLRTTGTRVEEVETVYLAGAFGVAIDPESAMAVGMFPRLPRERFEPVGNAAGMGAYLALVSESERREASRVAQSAGYLELMTLPGYQELFLSCLSFS
ncbi:MAG: ASKHA domain-containing protein [Bacillota bacterium]|nr:ASKHA domain-containing protein [Bacillota bacterium]